MEEVSRNLVIGPAKAINPKVKMVIKYPNWYEHYQGLGYNLEAEPKLFDGIYTGTETRDPVFTQQHLQQYQGYLIVRYLDNVKPGGNGGGWVDPFNRQYLDRYAEQLWLTLFAKSPEITLFSFGQLIEPVRQDDGTSAPDTMVGRTAGYVFDQADGFLGKLGKPLGVMSYKPYHSMRRGLSAQLHRHAGHPHRAYARISGRGQNDFAHRVGQVRSGNRGKNQAAIKRRQKRDDHLGAA